MSSTRQSRIYDRALSRMRLRQLKLLIEVGRQGSILNAAQTLNMSQPAATKMIKDLELDFEVSLFNRTNRGVLPTAFGDTLIRHSKLVFSQVSNAVQEMDDLSEGNSGRVVVGTLLAASCNILPRAISHLLDNRPNVSVRIVEGTNEVLMPSLQTGEIDLVVGRLPTHRHRKDLQQISLVDEKLLAVVGPDHPLARHKNLQFGDLAPFGWILPPPETTLRRQVDQFFIQQDQYHPPASVESVSYLSNRALLQLRNLVAIMPAHVISQDVDGKILSVLDWKVPFGEGPVGVSFRDINRLSPVARELLYAFEIVSVA